MPNPSPNSAAMSIGSTSLIAVTYPWFNKASSPTAIPKPTVAMSIVVTLAIFFEMSLFLHICEALFFLMQLH